MKTPAPNKSNPDANTKKLRNRIFALNVFILQLLETLHPLRELPFADTPLATDSESGQFLALEHPMHGSLGQLQHVSGLLESQQAQRLITVFRRCFHGRNLSNADAIPVPSRPAHSLERAVAQRTRSKHDYEHATTSAPLSSSTRVIKREKKDD